MGQAKEYYMRQQEEGWRSVGDKYVCRRCVGDYAIADFIQANAVSRQCSYCNRRARNSNATTMDQVLSFMAHGFRREYDIPENCLPYDSSEGGWMGRTPKSSDDVISDHEVVNWDRAGAEDLHDDLVRAFGDRLFIEQDPFGTPKHDSWRYSWDAFCATVKHKTRFVFFQLKKRRTRSYDPTDDHVTPANLILSQIGNLAEGLQLVRELPRHTRFVRARQHKRREKVCDAETLGSPPNHKAKQSRMSPAGITMFYGADDEKTAFIETWAPRDKRSRFVTFGTFETARTLRILDLAKIPDIPSIFDEHNFDQRSGIIFLRHLAEDISKPIKHDGREHYEYVPTQVAAEYFRSVLKVDDHRVDGIAFQSSRKDAGVSYCIFAGPENCADSFRGNATRLPYESPSKRLLVLTDHQRKSVAECQSLYLGIL